MEIEKRIEVAKLFIAKLAEICGGDRGLKLTAPAKVWQGGNKVRVYGLARQGYVEILEDGTVRNEIDRPFPEIFEAIDAVAAELAAPVAEESTEYDELVEWAIGEVRKVVDQFAPETVIDDRTKIFDLLPAGEERMKNICAGHQNLRRSCTNTTAMEVIGTAIVTEPNGKTFGSVSPAAKKPRTRCLRKNAKQKKINPNCPGAIRGFRRIL